MAWIACKLCGFKTGTGSMLEVEIFDHESRSHRDIYICCSCKKAVSISLDDRPDQDGKSIEKLGRLFGKMLNNVETTKVTRKNPFVK